MNDFLNSDVTVSEALAVGRVSESNMLAQILSKIADFGTSVTDIFVHEGRTVHVKSAKGLVRATDVVGTDDFMEAGEAEITRKQILFFLAGWVDGIRPSKAGRTSLSDDDLKAYWEEILAPSLKSNRSLDRAMLLQSGQTLRINAFCFDAGKLGLAIRLVPVSIAKLKDLGLPISLVKKIREANSGLVLICGPTGSSKTRTALAVVDSYNEKKSGHILTVEDPVEQAILPQRCVITQRHVGRDVDSYAQGMHEALRQNPDLIFVGEMRDADTAASLINAGESGCLAITTAHGNTVTAMLRKLISLGSGGGGGGTEAARGMLAGSLVCVIRLALVPMKDGTGYLVVCDAIFNDGRITPMVLEGKWAAIDALIAGNTRGDAPECINMNAALKQYVDAGKISKDAAFDHTSDPAGLLKLLGGIR